MLPVSLFELSLAAVLKIILCMLAKTNWQSSHIFLCYGIDYTTQQVMMNEWVEEHAINLSEQNVFLEINIW